MKWGSKHEKVYHYLFTVSIQKGADLMASPSCVLVFADYLINGTIKSATMLITLIIGLMAGPAVSL
jgi:hypothetical protein